MPQERPVFIHRCWFVQIHERQDGVGDDSAARGWGGDQSEPTVSELIAHCILPLHSRRVEDLDRS